LGRAPRTEAAAALTSDPRLGFYGPGSRMWLINREAALLGAGPTALLLQLAHPLVAEGVARHSGFEADPARRLRNTLRTTLALVFGDASTAEAAVRRLNRIHATVRGEVADPAARALAERYRALDPALLLWVQATLIWTSVQAYERWVGPLTHDDRARYWGEARQVGARLGIPLDQSPADWPAFEAYWARMLAPEGPVHVTPTGRRLGHLVLRAPLPLLPAPLAELLMLPALDLLPAPVRAEYAVPWGPARARLAHGLQVALRQEIRLLPRAWRAMPQARAAEARAAAAPRTTSAARPGRLAHAVGAVGDAGGPRAAPTSRYDRGPHPRRDVGRA